jgi:hypothetical protein
MSLNELLLLLFEKLQKKNSYSRGEEEDHIIAAFYTLKTSVDVSKIIVIDYR